ncbi:hypothetical protein [Photobacterium kishitanii]|uniref:hypothetical protein n=1 Tax=Photobacterium kishitanii TaxID=318456 RepID=UPI000AF6F55D|nr:hypothetical protein [Photobacterium kishitanii]
MSLFYVDKNAQDNGDHEIHTATCSHSPGVKNCDALGYHTACSTALDAAKKNIPSIKWLLLLLIFQLYI